MPNLIGFAIATQLARDADVPAAELPGLRLLGMAAPSPLLGAVLVSSALRRREAHADDEHDAGHEVGPAPAAAAAEAPPVADGADAEAARLAAEEAEVARLAAAEAEARRERRQEAEAAATALGDVVKALRAGTDLTKPWKDFQDSTLRLTGLM